MHKWFLLLVAVLISFTACSGQEEDKEEIVEILQISDDCASDNESRDDCCQRQCIGFCEKKSMEYAKHSPNVNHCACWCNG